MRRLKKNKSLRRNKHQFKGPKRDRLINYIWDLVNSKGWKTLNERRVERIQILYEVPECVLTEALNNCYSRWVRQQERLHAYRTQEA